MELSPATTALLTTLDAFSRHKLTRRHDLGVLIELSSAHGRKSLLEELGFLAKFLHRSFAIMQRIGREAEGYTQLSQEYSQQLERARGMTQQLVSAAPPNIRAAFDAAYFAMTPDALRNLMALFYDLSWYKNWLIDHPHDSH